MKMYYRKDENDNIIETNVSQAYINDEPLYNFETEQEMVSGYDGYFYIKGTEPNPPISVYKEPKIAELQNIITQQEQKALRPSQDLQAFGNDYLEYADDMQALKELRTAIKANRALIKQVNNAINREEIELIQPIKVGS